MNSGVRLDQCDVVQPTIILSLMFTSLKMLPDAFLDTGILSFVIQNNDCIVECLDACGCRQIDFVEERITALGVHLLEIK